MLAAVTSLLLLLTACAATAGSDTSDSLTSINIIDRNGLSQTISSKDRLAQYKNVNFLNSQPYQKVMRVYGRDAAGNTTAVITSYHPNGEPQQYLDVKNGRAQGWYREWFATGVQRIEARVIGGVADFGASAEQSWLFDGTTRAWDEDGCLAAEVEYDKGLLHGVSTHYHSNGKVWKRIPYQQGSVQGDVAIYLDDGRLLQTSHHSSDVPHGPTRRYWCDGGPQRPSVIEEYALGHLSQGKYYDRDGNLIAQITDGTGTRATFGRTSVFQLQEYKNGIQEGRISVYSPAGHLVREYVTKAGKNHGKERAFYPPRNGQPPQPKIAVHWHQDKIQGLTETWYEDGTLESQREMSDNRRHGISTVWYRDGSLMMVEEYDKDRLLKGEYRKRAHRTPVSSISGGNGLATLFDGEGNFLKRIHYEEGNPVL